MNIVLKSIYTIIIILLLSQSIYSSFTIYNSDFEETQYFSFQDLTFYIASNTNSSFEFQYEIVLTDNSSTQYSQLFNVSTCSQNLIPEQYCTQLSLLDFIHSSNTSFVSAIEFGITKLSPQITSKTIFLDFIPPSIIIDYAINSQTQQLFIEVDVRDNLDSIISNMLFVELEDGNSQATRIFNTSFKTNSTNTLFNTSLNITSASRYTIIVESRDAAGNLQQQTRSFELQDIFPPKIVNLSIIDTFSNQIQLHFSIEDESNLSSWIVKLGSREFREDFTSSQTPIQQGNFEIVLSQFPNSEFTIFVEDEFSNSKVYNFTSQIEVIEIRNLPKLISNRLQIQAQNAQFCEIRGFRSISSSSSSLGSFENMTQTSSSSNIFEYELPSDVVEEVQTIEIECSNEFMTQQIEHTLEVDMTPPKIIEFNVEANNQGTIDIIFNVDNTTSRVEIEKDSRTLSTQRVSRDFQTNTLVTFTDSQVQYPQEYRYRIIVYDEVGNRNRSEEIRVIPQKSNVNLEIEVVEFDEFVQLLVSTEKEIQGLIRHNARFSSTSRFNSSSIFQTPTGVVVTSQNLERGSIEFENLQQEQLVFIINRIDSDFIISFEVEDSLSNKNSQDIQISRLKTQTTELQIEGGLVLQGSNSSSSISINTTQIDEEEDLRENKFSVFSSFKNWINDTKIFNILLWILIFVLIIVILGILFRVGPTWYKDITNSIQRERAYRELTQKPIVKKNNQKNKNSQKIFHFSFGHSKSVSFDKEIYRRLEDKKIQDTKKRLEEEERRRKLRTQQFNQRSEYDRAKFNDLNIKPLDLDFSRKTSSPRAISKSASNLDVNKDTNIDANTKSSVTPQNQKLNLKQNFFKSLFKKNKEDFLKSTNETKLRNSNSSNNLIRNSSEDNSSNFKESDFNKSNFNENINPKYSSTYSSSKNNLGLDEYLQKRTKAKRWFLLQKQVDEEIKKRL